LTDPRLAVYQHKLSTAERIQRACQLNEDKRQEILQEFAALYPHWKPQQVQAVVSKFMLLAAGLEIDHPVFETSFFDDLPPDYSFEANF
jgi:hypothetical protein